jgi:two-component system nitrate/nitrite response regulator NarL
MIHNYLIKILLIGDYSIFRSALRMLIETDKRMRVIGEAADGDGALDVLSDEPADIVVVDMSDDATRDLFPLFEKLSVPTLILVGQQDPAIYQKCLRIGVNGILLKEERTDTLFKAIERINDGEIWFDRTLMGATIRQLVTEQQTLNDNPRPHVVNSLTEREMQVVDLICKGLKNKAIAEALFITETTVRHHLTSVFNKLELSSRLELVVYAFKNGLVRTPSLEPGNGNGSHKGSANSNGFAARGTAYS